MAKQLVMAQGPGTGLFVHAPKRSREAPKASKSMAEQEEASFRLLFDSISISFLCFSMVFLMVFLPFHQVF